MTTPSTTAGPASGLVAAYLLNDQGAGTPLDWDSVKAWQPADGVLWVHLERGAPDTADWLAGDAGLNPIIQDALMATESRPRATPFAGGLLVFLRGVNLNPNANPEDMVGLRLWIEDHRVISVRQRRVMAVQTIRERVEAGRGPHTAGDFLTQIADCLSERMAPVLADIHDGIDALEDRIEIAQGAELRSEIYEYRHQAILLRRYMAPQREVLSRLQVEDQPWLSERNKLELRELADRMTRYVEELDEVRERAVLLKDEMIALMSERANRTMYLLTLVAAIMLPLSFITGLLGINVGGIPGADVKWAFALVCGILVLIGVVQIWLFRRWKWL